MTHLNRGAVSAMQVRGEPLARDAGDILITGDRILLKSQGPVSLRCNEHVALTPGHNRSYGTAAQHVGTQSSGKDDVEKVTRRSGPGQHQGEVISGRGHLLVLALRRLGHCCGQRVDRDGSMAAEGSRMEELNLPHSALHPQAQASYPSGAQ